MHASAVVDIPTIEWFLNEISIFFVISIDSSNIDEFVKTEWRIINN